MLSSHWNRWLLCLASILLISGCSSDRTDEATTVSNLSLSSTLLNTAYPSQFVTITATVSDENGAALSNATVQFSTSLGSFSPDTVVTESSVKTDNGSQRGQASVRLYPGAQPGTATITAYVNGLRQSTTVTIEGTVVQPELPDPTTLAISSSESALYVSGVSQLESSAITIRLLTSSGAAAKDAPAGINNVRVTLVTSPNGGETLSGRQASGEVIKASQSLDVASQGGVATVTLNSGRLPGVIELSAEALNDQGQPYNPAIRATLSTISIASGPAHSIVFSYPVTDSITDLGNGIYRKLGGLLVTDRHGNPVADGTVINLGVIDSVLVSNREPVIDYGFTKTVADGLASTVQGQANLTDLSNALFQSAVITRNNTSRYIQAQDRVLLFNAQAEDKSRFVAVAPSESSRVQVNKAYQNTDAELEYLIGASLLGAQVSGTDPAKADLVSGQAITKDGNATFYLTYPADNSSILHGCLPTDIDTRQSPMASSQVWIVAEASGSGATSLNDQACFSAISPLSLSANTTAISKTSTVALQLVDQKEIALPFMPITELVSYGQNAGGLVVTVSPYCANRDDRRTNAAGYCNLDISVAGGSSGDAATITLIAGDARLDIAVSIP
ncbi:MULTISPECIES: hypothetical protein [Rheinheimera]|uniref:Big-1 domain-containing protein n=1 Tax=Rheinheimera marina TaxID=1774958 RepID=A0ABV9JI39_9GAMM